MFPFWLAVGSPLQMCCGPMSYLSHSRGSGLKSWLHTKCDTYSYCVLKPVRKLTTTKQHILNPPRLQDQMCHSATLFLFASRSTHENWPHCVWATLMAHGGAKHENNHCGAEQLPCCFPSEREKLLGDKTKSATKQELKGSSGCNSHSLMDRILFAFYSNSWTVGLQKLMTLKFSGYQKETLFFMGEYYHHFLNALLEFLLLINGRNKRLLDVIKKKGSSPKYVIFIFPGLIFLTHTIKGSN